MPTNLTLYRGEKSQWWPPPGIRLISGMTIREPWRHKTPLGLFGQLQQEVAAQLGTSLEKKVALYAQSLRAMGRPFALATAWTDVGSFTSDYNYVIKIPNAYLFYWSGTAAKPSLGDAAAITLPAQVKQDFIVLNGPTLAASTILGFGHNTGTKEITFLHDLPISFVESCNGKPRAQLELKKKTDLSFDDKIKYGKLLR
jgi:hypothetical protein